MNETLCDRVILGKGALLASFVSLLLILLSLPSQAETSASATTDAFQLSIKHAGIRASAGEETLRYSPLWDGGSNETAKVSLSADRIKADYDMIEKRDFCTYGAVKKGAGE